jgi:hypothetical protein
MSWPVVPSMALPDWKFPHAPIFAHSRRYKKHLSDISLTFPQPSPLRIRVTISLAALRWP